MVESKKKWLYRALAVVLSVTLMAGTAVMSPIADFVGTNITAEASEESGVIYVPSEVNMSDITEGGFMLCRGMTIHNNTEDEISYKGYDDEDAEGLSAFASFVTYSGSDLVIPADGAFSAAKIQKVERKKDSTSASGYSRTLCLFRCNSVAVVIASDKEIGCLEAGDRVSKGSSFHNTSSNAIEVEYTLADGETINTMIPADSTVTFDNVYNVTYADFNTNGGNLRLEEYVPTRYTVNWRNYNGDILKTDHVIADTIPYYTGDTPQRESDSDGTGYTFKGWNSTIKAIKADIDYTATYGRAVAFQENVIVYNGDVLSITGTVMLNRRALSKKDHPISVEWSYGSYHLSISGSSYSVTGDYCGDADDVGVKFQPSGTRNNYKLVAVPAVYTVTWVDGDGNVIKTDSVEYGTTPEYDGETPAKTATAQYSYEFSGWDSEPTAVTGDVTYTAQFTEKFNGYTVTFDSNGGTAVDSQTVEENGTATEPEVPSKTYSTFDGWYLDGTLYDFDTPVTENITLTAHWTEQTVAIRFMDFNGEEKSALTITPVNNSFEDTSEQIAVPSAPYRDGYTFSGWQVGDKLYENADALKKALTALVAGVPEDAIIVNEVYAQIEVQYPATVTGGTIRNAQGDTNGSYKASEQVYVTATGGSAGQVFSHWEKSDIGNPTPVIVSYEKTYAFRMPSFGTKLTAVYKDNPEEKTGTAYIESVTAHDGNKLSFVSIVAIPNKSTILRAGLVACMEKDLKNGHTAPTIDYARFKKYNSTTCQNYTTFKYTWTKGNVAENEVWCVRSYLLYEDENGVQHTVYGDMVKANSDGVITE